jgi:hypothetical protein
MFAVVQSVSNTHTHTTHCNHLDLSWQNTTSHSSGGSRGSARSPSPSSARRDADATVANNAAVVEGGYANALCRASDQGDSSRPLRRASIRAADSTSVAVSGRAGSFGSPSSCRTPGSVARSSFSSRASDQGSSRMGFPAENMCVHVCVCGGGGISTTGTSGNG